MKRMPTINFHHADCMDFIRALPDKAFDLAIVDPPYGIGASGSMNMGHRVLNYKVTSYKKKDWDNTIPPPEFFKELFRISKNQIIWGGNYFAHHLPPSKCWLVWDKVQPENISFNMHELAWTSFDRQARIFKISIASGSNRISSNKDKATKYARIHPTQKPIPLYRWLLQNYARPGDRILDTHGGSMSIACACLDLGFDLDICELDADYFQAGVARFNRHKNRWHEDLDKPIHDPTDYSKIGLFATQNE